MLKISAMIFCFSSNARATSSSFRLSFSILWSSVSISKGLQWGIDMDIYFADLFLLEDWVEVCWSAPDVWGTVHWSSVTSLYLGLIPSCKTSLRSWTLPSPRELTCRSCPCCSPQTPAAASGRSWCCWRYWSALPLGLATWKRWTPPGCGSATCSAHYLSLPGDKQWQMWLNSSWFSSPLARRVAPPSEWCSSDRMLAYWLQLASPSKDI